MPVEIRVPEFGESVVEATVGRWLKQVGDRVAAGEPVVELETEKVNVEVAAEAGGVLVQVAHREGETVHPGDVLGVLGEGEGGRPAAGEAEPAAAPQPPTQAEWRPSSPAARELASAEGVDLARVAGSGRGGRVTLEDVSRYLTEATRAPSREEARAPEGGQVAAPAPSREKAQAPEAGPAAPRAPSREEAKAPEGGPVAAPPEERPPGRPEERVRLSRRRATIARRLVEAQRTTASLTTFNEVDLSAVQEVRRRRGEEFQKRHGVRLGLMSFFTKAAIGALKAFPQLNSELQGEEFVLKHYYDVGIAVSAEGGLVVPVLRDADRKTFAEIEREIAELASRARDGRLSLADLQGGTFTITNGGVFGSLLSTPILNAPQVGILGMHKIEDRPVASAGEVVIRPMMYVALTYDHRVVDGREAVLFLVKVKELIEDPEVLLLEG